MSKRRSSGFATSGYERVFAGKATLMSMIGRFRVARRGADESETDYLVRLRDPPAGSGPDVTRELAAQLL